MRVILSLTLAFVLALAGTGVARAIDPGVFGSCFEGACGYAAMLVALLGTLLLAPVVWIGAILFALLGWFLLTPLLWIAGLAAFAYAIVRSIRRARAEGRATRDLFIIPRT